LLSQARFLFSYLGVPNFAGSVVGTCDELVSALVEGTVGQGQDVRTENFEQVEVVVLWRNGGKGTGLMN
jgi:hypothetical protein